MAVLGGVAVLFIGIFAQSAGAQTVWTCNGVPATIIGTPQDNVLRGTSGPDVIVGREGNDVIMALDGDDLVCGGKGNDRIFGGGGFDVLYGAQGNDTIWAANGSAPGSRADTRGARMYGGAGDDTIHGSTRWDRMQGGVGQDQLFGYEGRDWIRAGPDNDAVDGGPAFDDLHGGNGRDTIKLTGGDSVRGGAGLDLCTISAGAPAFIRSCGLNTREVRTPPPTSNSFEDQFNGKLSDGWQWRFQNPEFWSLNNTPGWLTIVATDPAQNVLLRRAPDDAFQVQTAVRFSPTSNFQFAGVFVGTDETSYVQLGRAYCSSADVPGFCVNDGVYMDVINDMGVPLGAAVRAVPGNTDLIHLRIVVDGDLVSGYFSEDAETWTLVGQHTRPDPNIEVGLIAGQAQLKSAVAKFDYFALSPI